MRKISEDKKQQAMTLLSQRVPVARVARMTGVHRETLRRWLNPDVYIRHKEANKRYAENNAEKVKTRRKTYRKANRERLRAKDKAKYIKNKKAIQEYAKAYYAFNAESIKLKARQRYQRNRQLILTKEKEKRDRNKKYKARKRETYKLWAAQNKTKLSASKASYRKAVKQATPPWLNAEQQASIDALYTLRDVYTCITGEQHHVDHIVPLIAKKMLNGQYQHVACGLHVPWNLQVTTARYNLTKNCDLERSI